jgi:hypothetical protein
MSSVTTMINYIVHILLSFVFWILFFTLFVFSMCLVYQMLTDSLDCSFLIAYSVFSKVYYSFMLYAASFQNATKLDQFFASTQIFASTLFLLRCHANLSIIYVSVCNDAYCIRIMRFVLFLRYWYTISDPASSTAASCELHGMRIVPSRRYYDKILCVSKVRRITYKCKIKDDFMVLLPP